MSEKQWDVIVAGDLFIDLVMTGFSKLPGMGEEGFASAMERETGGGVATTSCGLSALGLRAGVFGVVGADEIDWFRTRFSQRGVDTSMLMAHPAEPTAITVAVSTPRDRIFYTYYGANALLPELLGRSETRERFMGARHVHFAYPVEPRLLAELAQWLRARGTTTSIDVGWQEAWLADPATIPALAHLDWFLPNEREAEGVTGESEPERMLAWFRERGVRGVALKLGPQGSAVSVEGEFRAVKSIAVTPLDTTGAGDCFDAGFLYGVLRGLPIEKSLRCGNICGALSTEAAGGIAGFPSLERLRALIG